MSKKSDNFSSFFTKMGVTKPSSKSKNKAIDDDDMNNEKEIGTQQSKRKGMKGDELTGRLLKVQQRLHEQQNVKQTVKQSVIHSYATEQKVLQNDDSKVTTNVKQTIIDDDDDDIGLTPEQQQFLIDSFSQPEDPDIKKIYDKRDKDCQKRGEIRYDRTPIGKAAKLYQRETGKADNVDNKKVSEKKSDLDSKNKSKITTKAVDIIKKKIQDRVDRDEWVEDDDNILLYSDIKKKPMVNQNVSYKAEDEESKTLLKIAEPLKLNLNMSNTGVATLLRYLKSQGLTVDQAVMKITNADTKIKVAEQKLKEKENELEDLKKGLKGTENLISVDRDMFSHLQSENEKIKKTLIKDSDRMLEKDVEINALKSKLETALKDKTSNSAQEQIRVLEDRIKLLLNKDTNMMLQKDIEISALKNELKDAKKSDKLLKEIEDLQTRIRELEYEKDNRPVSGDKNAIDLSVENVKLRKLMDETSKEIKELKQEIEELEKDKSKLVKNALDTNDDHWKSLADKEKTIAEQIKKINELEGGSTHKMTLELNAIKNDKRNLEIENKQLKINIEKMKTFNIDTKSKVDELVIKNEKMDKLIKDDVKEVERLNKELTRVLMVNGDLQIELDKRSNVTAGQEQVTSLKKQIETNFNENSELRKENENLRKEIMNKEREVTGLKNSSKKRNSVNEDKYLETIILFNRNIGNTINFMVDKRAVDINIYKGETVFSITINKEKKYDPKEIHNEKERDGKKGDDKGKEKEKETKGAKRDEKQDDQKINRNSDYSGSNKEYTLGYENWEPHYMNEERGDKSLNEDFKDVIPNVKFWGDVDSVEEEDVTCDPLHNNQFGGEFRERVQEVPQNVKVKEVNYLTGITFEHGNNQLLFSNVKVTGTPFDNELNNLSQMNWKVKGVNAITEVNNESSLVIGELRIVPTIDNRGSGPLGSFQGYNLDRFEYISYDNIKYAMRAVLNNGCKLMVPPILLSQPEHQIRVSFFDLISKVKNKFRNQSLNHSLLNAALNNLWRNEITMEFSKFNDAYIKGEPVFGHVLQSLNDGNIIKTNGHSYIVSPSIGGFSVLDRKGERVGPYKNGSTQYKRSIVWDLDKREVNYNNLIEIRTDIQKFYPSSFIMFHLYQSHGTCHMHKFDSLDSYIFHVLCDLITDRNYSYLRKGFLLDVLWPLTEATLDWQVLCVMYYGLGVRLNSMLFNLGIKNFANLKDEIIKQVFTTELFIKVKSELRSHNIYVSSGYINSFSKFCVLPPGFNVNDVHISYTTKGNCVFSGGNEVTSFKRGIPNFEVLPSDYALEYDVHGNTVSGIKTHDTTIVDYRDTDSLPVPIYYKSNGCRCYKFKSQRGYSKMFEMASFVPINKSDKIIILGDGQGGFTKALVDSGINVNQITVIDLKFKKKLAHILRERAIVTDVFKLSLSFFKKYDIIISDLCSKKGPKTEFGKFYQNLYSILTPNQVCLWKIKGLYDGEKLSKFGLWVDLVGTKNTFVKIIKPASSRLRNSESYLMFTKDSITSGCTNLIEKYSAKLVKSVKTNITLEEQINMMGVVTPPVKMKFLDFVPLIPNGANVEIISNEKEIMRYLGYAFEFSRMFFDGAHYCFQGKKFLLARSFCVCGGLYDPFINCDLDVGKAGYIGSYTRLYHNKCSGVANSVKHQLIKMDLIGRSCIEFGGGKSGNQRYNNELVSYPSLFSNYKSVDPVSDYPDCDIPFNKYVQKEKFDVGLMIQSSHYIVGEDGKEIKDMLEYCDEVIYSTFLRSAKRISRTGGDWYNNDGTFVTFSGQTQRITPVFGDVIKIDMNNMNVYNRIINDNYVEVLRDAVLVRVTKDNFGKKDIEGGSYQGDGRDEDFKSSPEVVKEKGSKKSTYIHNFKRKSKPYFVRQKNDWRKKKTLGDYFQTKRNN